MPRGEQRFHAPGGWCPRGDLLRPQFRVRRDRAFPCPAEVCESQGKAQWSHKGWPRTEGSVFIRRNGPVRRLEFDNHFWPAAPGRLQRLQSQRTQLNGPPAGGTVRCLRGQNVRTRLLITSRMGRYRSHAQYSSSDRSSPSPSRFCPQKARPCFDHRFETPSVKDLPEKSIDSLLSRSSHAWSEVVAGCLRLQAENRVERWVAEHWADRWAGRGVAQVAGRRADRSIAMAAARSAVECPVAARSADHSAVVALLIAGSS
jgi:hypothetical protein